MTPTYALWIKLKLDGMSAVLFDNADGINVSDLPDIEGYIIEQRIGKIVKIDVDL